MTTSREAIDDILEALQAPWPLNIFEASPTWPQFGGVDMSLRSVERFWGAPESASNLAGVVMLLQRPCRSALPQPFLEAVGGLLQEPGQLPPHLGEAQEVPQAIAVAPLIGAR